MHKIFLGVCAISVSAALIGPKIIANNVETNIYAVVEKVNQIPGYSAAVTDYQSSWFTTQSLVEVKFDMAIMGADLPDDVKEEFDKFAIDLVVNANHGPILTEGDAVLGLTSMTIDLANEELREHLAWADGQPLYSLELHTDLLGQTNYKDAIEAFKVKEEEGFTVSFDGYQGKGQLSNNSVTYSGKSKDTTFQVENQTIVLGPMEIDMQVDSSFADMLASAFYDSNSKINISTVRFNSEAENSQFLLNNFYLEAISKIDHDKKLGNFEITYGVDNLTAGEFTAKDMALTLEINNINETFVNAYQDSIYDLSSGTEEQVQAKLIEFMHTQLLTLLKSEPELNIASLRGTLEQGSFESSINTSLRGITQIPAGIDGLAAPQFWLSHLLANGQIQGDKAVIEYLATQIMTNQLQQDPQTDGMTVEEIEQLAMQQVPQLLQMFAQQGLVVADEKGYITKFNFKDKILTINDNPIPLPL